MKATLMLTTIFIVFIFLTCGNNVETAKVEVIDGVKCIHCPAMPLHPKKTIVFEEELTIGEEDESGEIILFQPGFYLVDSKGNICIGDRSDQKIKIFDNNGKYLKSFAGKGSGPGEFQSIGRMYWLPDGRLIVTDYRSRRTSFFKTDGEFLYSFQWKTYLSGVYLTTDSSFTCEENNYGEDKKLYIKTFNFKVEESLNYGEFAPVGFHTLRSGDMSFAISLPYDPKSVFTGDQKHYWLYHCLNDKYLVEVYDQNGKLFRKIDRPYEPVPFTEKDRDEYLKSFSRRDDNSVFTKMAKEVQLPSIKTITERMIVDEQSNLWVETNEEKNEDGKTFTAYDIFNKDGYYEARVWSDIRPRLFANGKVYSYYRDKETGLRVLKRYRVVWKEK